MSTLRNRCLHYKIRRQLLFQQIIAVYSENIRKLYFVHVVYLCHKCEVRRVSAFITNDMCSDLCTLKKTL